MVKAGGGEGKEETENCVHEERDMEYLLMQCRALDIDVEGQESFID